MKRKQSDFNSLRQVLNRLYPGFVVPPLPKKPLKRLEPDLMNARKEKLQLFLNDVLKHPVLNTCGYLWRFLSAPDEKEFDKIKAEYEKLERPGKISDFITEHGKAKIILEPHTDFNCDDIKRGAKDLKSIFKKYFCSKNFL